MKKVITNMVILSTLAVGIATPVSTSTVSPNNICAFAPCEVLK